MLTLWYYRGRLHRGAALFDKAQIRGKRLDFIRPRWLATIGIGDSVPNDSPDPIAQVGPSNRNRPVHPGEEYRARPRRSAMTGIAGHDIGFRDAFQVDRSSRDASVPSPSLAAFGEIVAK